MLWPSSIWCSSGDKPKDLLNHCVPRIICSRLSICKVLCWHGIIRSTGYIRLIYNIIIVIEKEKEKGARERGQRMNKKRALLAYGSRLL